MRPRAIIWRRCPASAALKEILAALLSSLTPATAAKALASRFNRAPPVAARPETKTMNERPNMFAQNDNPLSVHSRGELPDDQLRVLAPSVFAAQPISGVSPRYAFVPTAQLVSRLREAGWAPVSAVEQRIRIEDRRGFQKHLIRFQRRDVVPVKGEYTLELCLINSHDRSSAYQLHAGLYRFICANGMFVGDGNAFERVSIRHAGFTPDEVIEASFRILDQVPAITASVEAFRARQLTGAESRAFATAALRLRYNDVQTAPIGPSKLLEARRYEDAGDNLWNVFNRVSEHLLRGGLRDESRSRVDGRRFPRTRAITGLDRNVKLNKALWSLAQRMANGEPLSFAE